MRGGRRTLYRVSKDGRIFQHLLTSCFNSCKLPLVFVVLGIRRLWIASALAANTLIHKLDCTAHDVFVIQGDHLLFAIPILDVKLCGVLHRQHRGCECQGPTVLHSGRGARPSAPGLGRGTHRDNAFCRPFILPDVRWMWC